MAIIQAIRNAVAGGDNSASANLGQIIKAGRQVKNRTEVQALLDACGEYLPSADYVDHVRQLRDYFNGRQVPYLLEKLAERFEVVHDEMDPITLNIVRASAGLEAQVYRKDPDRWIEYRGERVGESYTEAPGNGDGDVPPVTKTRHAQHAKRADIFVEALRRCRLNVVMPESERSTVTVGTMIGRVMWSGKARKERGLRPRPELDVFYPCDFRYIPDPNKPAMLDAAHVIMLRSSSRRWQVWTRDDKTWSIQIVDEDGGPVGLVETWKGKRLPIFAMHSRPSPASVYLDIDRDILAFQDAVNMELTDHGYRSRLSGHKQIVITGAEGKPGQKRASGVGTAWTFDSPQTRVQTIDIAMSLTGLEGVEKLLRMLGISKQQPPDAWATEPGPPLSGISRIVANIPSDQKRKEGIALCTEVEEENLLPILVDVCDTYGASDLGGKIGHEGFSYRVRFPKPEVYEEPEARRLTSSLAQKDGWISPAAAAVRAGFYPSLEDARAAGLATVIEPPKDVAGGAAKAVGAMAPNEDSPRAPLDAERDDAPGASDEPQ